MMHSRKTILNQFFLQHKSIVLLTLLSSFIGSLLSVLLPLSIGIYYELAFQDNSGKSKLLHELGIHISSLQSYFAYFVVFIALKAISAWTEAVGMRAIEERFAHRMRQLIFHSQLSHHYTGFLKKTAGKYLLRYSSDMLALQYYLSKGIIKCIADIMFLLLAFLILLRIDSRLTVILAIMMLVSALIMTWLSKLQSDPNDLRRSARSSLIGFIEQRLQAFATIKAFNRAHPEEAKFNKRNEALLKNALRYHRLNTLNKSIPQIAFFIAIGTLLFCASPLMSETPPVYGALLIFILMLLYMQSAFRRLLRVPSYLNAGNTSFESLTALLNSPSEVMHTTHTAKELKRDSSITIKSLHFSHNEDKPFLNIDHWQFAQNGLYRIEGASGSGKSTLLKLLLKLYPVGEQQILIGNTDINAIGAHDLRKIMTIVGEDFPLLGKSIFEAISYSRKETNKDAAAEMLITLGLTTQQAAMDYLSFSLKPNAGNLSSGERRMLNVARALLTHKKILLLDEPYLGLNADMKKTISHELMQRKGDHLIILVAQEIPSDLIIDHTFTL